jgi:hypothetical protein
LFAALLMVSPVHGDHRRCPAEIPLIVLCRFPEPVLAIEMAAGVTQAPAGRSRTAGVGGPMLQNDVRTHNIAHVGAQIARAA